MLVELLPTTAVAMAGLSMGLTIGSALGSRRGATPQPAAPPSAAAVTPKRITTRPVLQEHARTIGIDRSKSWIHGATRAELQAAIREHNLQRRAADA